MKITRIDRIYNNTVYVTMEQVSYRIFNYFENFLLSADFVKTKTDQFRQFLLHAVGCLNGKSVGCHLFPIRQARFVTSAT
jgi:hypothetical protein